MRGLDPSVLFTDCVHTCQSTGSKFEGQSHKFISILCSGSLHLANNSKNLPFNYGRSMYRDASTLMDYCQWLNCFL